MTYKFQNMVTIWGSRKICIDIRVFTRSVETSICELIVIMNYNSFLDRVKTIKICKIPIGGVHSYVLQGDCLRRFARHHSEGIALAISVILWIFNLKTVSAHLAVFFKTGNYDAIYRPSKQCQNNINFNTQVGNIVTPT